MSKSRNPSEISIQDVRNECVAVRLRVITRAVTKLYNTALHPYGLTISQMNILVAISSQVEAKQQQISHALHLEKSTMSRDVKRMIDKRWLRSNPGTDGRVVLTVTAEGTKLLTKAIPAWQEAQEQALELLGETGIGTLGRLAQGLSTGLRTK